VANEDSAIRASSWANSIKVELENTATNGKLYELRSNNNGNFEIMDRTGSASRYEISSSGSHTIRGSATITGDLAINGIANVTSSLATKQNLVNPVLDIPDWLRLNSAHFEYMPGIFGETPATSVSRNILTLKTANLPYAPTNNPVFTGNASIAGDLDIGGELSVNKIKRHSTSADTRIEFSDGVLFSQAVSIAGNYGLNTNSISPSTGGNNILSQGDLILSDGATILNPNKSLKIKNLEVENITVNGANGQINQSKVAGLEDALDEKQPIISVIDGIRDYVYPQERLYFRSYLLPLGSFSSWLLEHN